MKTNFINNIEKIKSMENSFNQIFNWIYKLQQNNIVKRKDVGGLIAQGDVESFYSYALLYAGPCLTSD